MVSRRKMFAMGAGVFAGLARQNRRHPEICILSKHLQWLSIGDAAGRRTMFPRLSKWFAALDILRYRWGGFPLDPPRSIPQEIAADRAQVRDLAALNKQYGICAMYHTHSGAGCDGCLDLGSLPAAQRFRLDLGRRKFDIGHVTVEGGLGGWIDCDQPGGAHRNPAARSDYSSRDDEPSEAEPCLAA
jgi:hypothetical protein